MQSALQPCPSGSARPFTHTLQRSARQLPRRPSAPLRLPLRAQAGPTDASEEDFEARLAALKKAKGQTPFGEGKKQRPSASSASGPSTSTRGRKAYDYSDETLHYEGGPSLGDVAVNTALGITLVWLPLTIAAIGRAAFLKYRFTDLRLSVITSAPWKSEQIDAAYQEVKEVVTVGRGIGLWGDMVVTLRDGSKIELRAVEQWQELKKYILQRRDELTAEADAAPRAKAKGFAE